MRAGTRRRRHRFDHRGQPGASVEDVGMLDGGGGVEPPAGSLQQPFDDVAVLPFAGRLVEGEGIPARGRYPRIPGGPAGSGKTRTARPTLTGGGSHLLL